MSRPARRSSPERMGPILEALLADAGYLAACREQDIVRMWPELVGERIAAATECMSAERGIVHVQVRSAAWRNELMYLKPMLLARLRSQCTTIKDIVFA